MHNPPASSTTSFICPLSLAEDGQHSTAAQQQRRVIHRDIQSTCRSLYPLALSGHEATLEMLWVLPAPVRISSPSDLFCIPGNEKPLSHDGSHRRPLTIDNAHTSRQLSGRPKSNGPIATASLKRLPTPTSLRAKGPDHRALAPTFRPRGRRQSWTASCLRPPLETTLSRRGCRA